MRFVPFLFLCCSETLPVVNEIQIESGTPTCFASPPASPEKLEQCNSGSGVFGSWFTDSTGLPAYRYQLDGALDERALWNTTEKSQRRDAWFAIGNERLNVMPNVEGRVEISSQDRVVSVWNQWNPNRKQFSGGFGFISDDETAWSTAYVARPTPSRTVREYGSVSAHTSIEYRGILADRVLFSPSGNESVVLADLSFTNTSKQERKFSHDEFWDLARREIAIEWVASGDLDVSIPQEVRNRRDALNDAFDETASFDVAAQALVVRRSVKNGVIRPSRETPNANDWYPDDIFLARLDGTVNQIGVDQNQYFGTGGLNYPDALKRKQPLVPPNGFQETSRSASGQPHMLLMRSLHALKPGETTRVRYALGSVPTGAPVHINEEWKTVTPEKVAVTLKEHLMFFSTPGAPHLSRELPWHAAQLAASVGYREYFGQRVVPQGSSYLYLHGADGAARDLGLFALPLTYINPLLAADELRLFMKITHGADRRFSYAFDGHGMLDDALGLHRAPSDLPLYFLWALTDYIWATGDENLLDERVDYWPKGSVPNATGFTHLQDAVTHLIHTIGFGPHGLLRVQTGDWNDAIVVGAADRDRAIAKGESVPNSQMALYVLPRAAQLLDARDKTLAAEIRALLPGLREAVAKTFVQNQFGRAYFGDDTLVRSTEPDLESMVWPLISGDGFPNMSSRNVLLERALHTLDTPSPTGATLTPSGQVWPAVTALLTWGYQQSGRTDLAFLHVGRNTLLSHANTFPAQWAGIWSAADGHMSDFGEQRGKTWSSAVTPMLDWPIQNNNAHAMPLFAALKACGIEATPTGVRVAPGQTSIPFSLKTHLIDARLDAHHLEVIYRPSGTTARRLTVEIPNAVVHAFENDVPVPLQADQHSVTSRAGTGEQRLTLDW
jgi:hypothetical protein